MFCSRNRAFEINEVKNNDNKIRRMGIQSYLNKIKKTKFIPNSLLARHTSC
jgi:hypothetical protein